MWKSVCHSIIIKKNLYDIVSADAQFYSFMGNRLYSPFNELIDEKNRDSFYEHAAVMDGKWFAAELKVDEGFNLPVLMSIVQGTISEYISVSLYALDAAMRQIEENSVKIDLLEKVLGLYGDWGLKCNLKTQEVTIQKFRIDETVEKSKYSIDEFEKMLLAKFSKEKVVKFFAELKNGNRDVEECFDGALYGGNDIKYTQIKVSAIYADGEIKNYAGFIHEGNEQVVNVERLPVLDSLTGLLSKGDITEYATRLIDVEHRKGITIAIVDVDYFKRVNDTFGHKTGDEVLTKVAAIIKNEIGEDGVIGRFGGDEFMIVLFNAFDLEYERERLRSIKNMVRGEFPENSEGKPSTSLSIGCASYPKDADNYEDVFTLADFALYRAKEKGRNRYIIYDKSKHGSINDIKQIQFGSARLNSRGDMSKSDIICMILDKVTRGIDYPIEKLADDLVDNIGIQHLIIYGNNGRGKIVTAGQGVPDSKLIEETKDYILDGTVLSLYTDNVLVINDISYMKSKSPKVYEKLNKEGLRSLLHIVFRDNKGSRCVLSIESAEIKVTWNENDLPNFRLIGFILSHYDFT